MPIEIQQRQQLMRFYDGQLLPDEMLEIMTRDQGWFPSRPLKRGSWVREFPMRDSAMPKLEIYDKGRCFDLYDFINVNNVVGMLILKNGEIAFESYQRGLTPQTLWHSCSLAKSVASTALGIAVKEGLLSLDDPLSRYADLGSAYAKVTVRQLLRMNSGIQWNEDYGDPLSERRKLLDIQIRWEKGGIVDFMRACPASASPGMGWVYNTGESYLVSAVMEGATGKNLIDYTSDRLWSQIGMAQDARWWVESFDSGMAISGSGMYATLGDYARVGQFMLEEGRLGDAILLPDGWLGEAGSSFKIDGKKIPYGYMWWIPELDDALLETSFQAEGIYGQYIHVNPRHGIVAVLACARSKPSYKKRLEINDDAFFAALARAL